MLNLVQWVFLIAVAAIVVLVVIKIVGKSKK